MLFGKVSTHLFVREGGERVRLPAEEEPAAVPAASSVPASGLCERFAVSDEKEEKGSRRHAILAFAGLSLLVVFSGGGDASSR